jgi:uncharacterized membrane protein
MEGSFLTFKESIDLIGNFVEAAGVAVIVVGLVWASVQYLRQHRVESAPPAYIGYRRSLGRAVLLGLEFLVAGDIIRTVATELTFRGLGALALLILIRTFLSVEIEMEIEGRWPWQGNRTRPGLQTGQAEGE